MEILYLLAVLAVIALCIALFSTSRRILHSTPLTNGDLSLSNVDWLNPSRDREDHDFEDASMYDETPELENSEDTVREDTNIDPYLLPRVVAAEETPRADDLAAALPIQNLSVSETDPVLDAAVIPEFLATAQETMEGPSASLEPAHETRIRIRPWSLRSETEGSSRIPHYILECMLIGISVFVLVKTQKSTSQQYRSRQASNRVA